jgi:hypothetical protein
MSRRNWLLCTSALAGLAVSGLGLAASNIGRSDCPGQIVCPLTGELVCKDRCPLDQGKLEAPPCCQR